MYVAFCLALLATDPTPPAPAAVFLTAPKTITVRLGEKILIEAKTSAKKVTWKTPIGIDTEAIDGGKRLACWAGEGTYRLLASIPRGEDVLHSETILIVTGPRPPPTPPQPPPDPVPPTPPQPEPVKSFRVIFAFETSSTLTAAQTGVIYARDVQNYLNSHCTKESNFSEWRRYDQNVNTSNELPNMKALWAAVQPKLTVLPCLVIEKNGKADILPLPATVADALAVLKSYGGP